MSSTAYITTTALVSHKYQPLDVCIAILIMFYAVLTINCWMCRKKNLVVSMCGILTITKPIHRIVIKHRATTKVCDWFKPWLQNHLTEPSFKYVPEFPLMWRRTWFEEKNKIWLLQILIILLILIIVCPKYVKSFANSNIKHIYYVIIDTLNKETWKTCKYNQPPAHAIMRSILTISGGKYVVKSMK